MFTHPRRLCLRAIMPADRAVGGPWMCLAVCILSWHLECINGQQCSCGVIFLLSSAYRRAEAAMESCELFIIRAIVRFTSWQAEPGAGKNKKACERCGRLFSWWYKLHSTFDQGDTDWWAGRPSTALTLCTRWANEENVFKKRKGYSPSPDGFNEERACKTHYCVISHILYSILKGRCVRSVDGIARLRKIIPNCFEI